MEIVAIIFILALAIVVFGEQKSPGDYPPIDNEDEH